jgi:uncharacterized protein (DUF952 family)
MTKKSQSKANLGISPARLLSLVVAFLLLTTGYLLLERRDFSHQLAEVRQDANEQANLLKFEIDTQKALQRPVVFLKDSTSAIPELRLALPYNDVTKTLQYSYDNEGNVRVTSTLINDRMLRQISCTDLVRATVKDGTVYSPWEEDSGSVKLSDGRTLHIYAARAYKNDQASTEACAEEVWKQITPQQVAAEFKKAHAY